MKTWKTIITWLRGGCVYFTLISLAILLLSIMLEENTDFAVSALSYLVILPMGLVLSFAEMLYKLPSMPRWAAALSHYGLTMASFFLFMWAPRNLAVTPAQVFFLFVVLSAVYWVIWLTVHLLRGRIRRLMEDD